jgi:hypothetical protein
MSYSIFLKFLGLEPLKTSRRSGEKGKKFFVVAYPFFVFGLLCYHPLILFLNSLEENRLFMLSRFFFLLIDPIQYYVSYFYFYDKRRKLESKNIVERSTDGYFNDVPKEKTLFRAICVFSLIFIIISLVALGLNIQESDSNNYLFLPEGFQLLNYFIVSVSFVYSKCIITLNMHIFVFSFLEKIDHTRKIRIKLVNFSRKNGESASMASLCYEIFDIKYSLSKLIKKLENIYIYSTILGSVGLGFMISSGESDPQSIVNIIIFFVMQIVFLFVIQAMGKEREYFLEMINHRSFVSRYILHRNKYCHACLQIKHENQEEKLMETSFVPKFMCQYDESRKTENREDYLIDTRKDCQTENRGDCENKKEHSESEKIPEPFCVFRNETNEPSDIEMSVTPEEKNEKNEDINAEIRKLLSGGNHDPHILADSGCFLTTDEFIRCIYEWVTNTGSTVDWIVLNTILNENWASFSFFGIEFSDGTALRKAIYVTIVLISASSAVGIIENLET